MNAKISRDFPAPPTYLAAFRNGFNAVANHIYVILFPVLLDLFLLFGPQFRIARIFAPLYNYLQVSQILNLTQLSPADQVKFLNALKEYISRINLLSILSTFPIGVPSIMVPGVLENPLGLPLEINLNSTLSALLLMGLLYLVGAAFCVIYYNLLASLSSDNKQTPTLKTFLWQYFQIMTFSIWLILMVYFIILPIFFVVYWVQLLSPIVSQILFFGFLFLILWLGFPLVFTPHGVFAYNQNILAAAFTSYRLVRNALPSAGLFMSMVILLYLVSLELWVIPPDNSWLILAGIIGHAFLFSALFVSTLFYYRGSINWMREIIKRNTTSQPTSLINH